MSESADTLVAKLLGLGARTPPGQVAAATALGRPDKWRSLHHKDESLLWGEIRSSSGSSVYRVACVLADAAFTCSCPAMPKPCKHGLALLVAFARAREAFSATEPPVWVVEWVQARTKRSRSREARPAEIVDPEAQARRAAEREGRIAAGLDELERWIGDLVRQGLAGADGKPYAFWDGPAARLVDAQAPGLARRVRSLYGVATSDGWPERLLERLGLLQLLVTAYRRSAELPEELRAEVRQLVGWNVSQDALLQSAPPAKDGWRVVGWRIEEDERLRSQRVWLLGTESRRFALILNFAPTAAPLDRSLYPGTTVDADLVFFPGVRAQRALVKEARVVTPGLGAIGGSSVGEAAADYAAALAQNPWLEDAPVLLRGVVPVKAADSRWILRDADGRVVPLSARFGRSSMLVALAGGRASTVFGEWNGRSILPLGVGTEERYVPFDA